MRLKFVVNVLALIMIFSTVTSGLGGCTSRTARDDSMMFDVAGPVAIDVESFNGDVTVRVDESLTQAEVKVTRVADLGYGRAKEAKLAVEEIDYSAELESGANGPTLVVKTWSTHNEPHYQRANVTIKLPAVNGLNITTDRGNVKAINTAGQSRIATERGNIRFMTDRPMTESVNITSERGDIDYRVRGESSGFITAQTKDGKVRQRHMNAKMRISEATGRRLQAMLNDGTNQVDLTTQEGDIRIAIVENPTEVGTFIIDP